MKFGPLTKTDHWVLDEKFFEDISRQLVFVGVCVSYVRGFDCSGQKWG